LLVQGPKPHPVIVAGHRNDGKVVVAQVSHNLPPKYIHKAPVNEVAPSTKLSGEINTDLETIDSSRLVGPADPKKVNPASPAEVKRLHAIHSELDVFNNEGGEKRC
jgi:hypothetical protein